MRRILRTPHKPILLPPLSLSDCIEAVHTGSKAYAEATNLPAIWTTRSWFVVEFARQIHKVRGPRGAGILAVETDGDPARVGNFSFNFSDKSGLTLDLVACASWGHESPDDDEYGKDEPFLPAFHVVKLFLNTQREWPLPSEIAQEIKGPLTVTLVWINHFGTEAATLEAMLFKSKMEGANLPFALSTEMLRPGILAAVTLFERAAPFQILTVSEVFAREPLSNPLFKEATPTRPLRGPNLPGRRKKEN